MYFAYDRHATDLADVLDKTLFDALEQRPDVRFYALVDSAFAPQEVAALLDKAPYQQAKSIYADTPLQGFEELAPVLVHLPSEMTARRLAIADWLTLCDSKPMLSFVATQLAPPQLTQHFSAFLQIRDDSNMRYTLRFADTRMTSAILDCLPPEQKQAWLAGMSAWWLIGRNGGLQLLGGTQAPPVAAQPNDWHDLAISDAQLIQLHDNTEADIMLSYLYETMPESFAGHQPSALYQQANQLLRQLDRQQISDDHMRLTQVRTLLAAA